MPLPSKPLTRAGLSNWPWQSLLLGLRRPQNPSQNNAPGSPYYSTGLAFTMKFICQPWHQYNKMHVGVLSIYYPHWDSVPTRPGVSCETEIQERHCRKYHLNCFPKLTLFLCIAQESLYTSKRKSKKQAFFSAFILHTQVEINTQVITLEIVHNSHFTQDWVHVVTGLPIATLRNFLGLILSLSIASRTFCQNSKEI